MKVPDITKIPGVPELPEPLFYRLQPPCHVLMGHELHIRRPGRFGLPSRSLSWARVYDPDGIGEPEELIARAAQMAYDRLMWEKRQLASARSLEQFIGDHGRKSEA